MIIIDTDAALTVALSSSIDTRLKDLLRQRRSALDELNLPFEAMAKFVVVQPGDSIEALEAELGFSITYDRFSCSTFGCPGFTPAWEWVLEHDHCYETVFVLSDDGYAVVLFVQKRPGVDALLLAMLKAFMA